ncbi:MAG: hypothetical protein KZQ58_04610 [gamma proteobacterium symbiont of Bathyaustriella thionipta]|nr:hypothetical protein [gamma proteobacterium symbiont of Bathyaustriella thionipta]
MGSSALGLELPKLHAADESNHLSDISKNKKWVKDLPLGSIGDTSKLIYHAIHSINQLQLDPSVRFRITEQMRPPLKLILRNIEKKYIDNALPLSEKRTRFARLNMQLLESYATSYKICIESALSANKGRLDKKLLVVAIHRAITMSAEAMVHNNMIYTAIPGKAWKESHRLFAFAQQNKLDALKIKDVDNSRTSITDRYKRMLLLAMASPYRMRQRDIRKVYDKLPAWTHLIEFEQGTKAGRSLERGFILSLWSDEPPTHGSLTDMVRDKHTLAITTESLISRLKDKQNHSNADHDSALIGMDEIPHYLLKQLIKAWSKPEKRSFSRTRLKFELSVVVGLPAIFHFANLLSEQSSASPYKEEAAETEWPAEEASQQSYASALAQGALSDDFSLMPQAVEQPQDEALITQVSNAARPGSGV